MKKYPASAIRNICLMGHQGVGKSSMSEALCLTSNATSKLGKVDNGSSIFDSRVDEKNRKMTISMSVGCCEWKDSKINMLDTPGFLDFLGDVRGAMRVVESSVILVDAAAGIEVGTELVSRYADEFKMPKIYFINGMSKENANFNKVLSQLKESVGSSVAPIQVPIGSNSSFKGVVDILENVAYEYTPDGNGRGKKVDIPADMVDKITDIRSQLMEAIAESDEELMNTYFENGELSDTEMKKGLAAGVAQGIIFPVLCGSGGHVMGIDLLLDEIVNLCPPANTRKELLNKKGESLDCSVDKPNIGYVFKTLSEEHVGEINIVRVFNGHLKTGEECYNSTSQVSEKIGGMFYLRGKERVETTEISTGDIGGLLKLKDTHTGDTLTDKNEDIVLPKIKFPKPLVEVAIRAKSKGDDDKIGTGLGKIREEDPTFSYQFRPDVRQSILSAMGDIHIDVILENLKNRFKVEVEKMTPKVSYRETITKTVKYVEYTHKKQSGGAGQYARVFIDMEPKERGEGYEFLDKIVGGVIDGPLRPSVDKGIKVKMVDGILAGYPIVDIGVSLVDGKTHPVDSKDVAFQIAGREVFKKAFLSAGPILLEPIMTVAITVPDEYTGDVMGDLSSRRGKIGGMEPDGKYQRINAKVPQSEVQNYSQALRSITQGRGFYELEFSHYDPVPGDLTKKIIEQSEKSDNEDS